MPNHPAYQEIIDRTSLNLCSLLASLNEFPYFRFDTDQSITGQIAARTYTYLEDRLRHDADFWYRGCINIRNRSTVLIISRLSDMITPLLHSIAYEAMMKDYLHVNHSGKISINSHSLLTFLAGGLPPSINVEEECELWESIRDLRIECMITKSLFYQLIYYLTTKYLYHISDERIDAHEQVQDKITKCEKSLQISNQKCSPIRSLDIVVHSPSTHYSTYQ